MATNLFNKDHKATSDKYRKGYDRIRWEKPRKDDPDSEKDQGRSQ